MLIELISKNAGQDQEEYSYKPSPSKVGHCIRDLTYQAMGMPADPFPDRAMFIFEDGHIHEMLILDHIRKTVFELTEWKGKNQRITIAHIEGKVMDGEIDGLITDPLGVVRMIEIKSINHFGFERLDDKPLDDHRRQANLYLHGLTTGGFPEITECLIIYKNKNTSVMKEFIVVYDEAQALADIEMFRQIARWRNENKVPPRPYTFDDWHCQYCRRQKFCWKDYPKEIEQLSTDVALDEELATSIRYYRELGAHVNEQDKERQQIGETLKAVLRKKGAKSGRAGEYIITLSASMREQIDKSLVPLEAITQVPSERFTVKKIEEKTI